MTGDAGLFQSGQKRSSVHPGTAGTPGRSIAANTENAKNGSSDFRLYRGGRGIGRVGSRQPAERQLKVQSTCAGSRPRKPPLVAHSGRLCETDRKPSRQLAVFV